MTNGNSALTRLAQYLTFALRGECFAIEIARVREVLDVAALTKVPGMPECFCGVINLRGKVMPILDLGRKLGLAPLVFGTDTCVIIVEVLGENGAFEVGVLTDSVPTVVELAPDAMEAVPNMGAGLDTGFISGMARLEEKFLMLLAIDTVLAGAGANMFSGMDTGAFAGDHSAAGAPAR